MTEFIVDHSLDGLLGPDDSDYEFEQEFTDEFMLAAAEKKGCTVEYSDDLTLQLDLDSEGAYQTYLAQVEMIDNLIPELLAAGETIRPSKSGNRHVTLKLNAPAKVQHRIMLQALLGSDIKREMLAWIGYQKGQKNPVVLFRSKE